MPSHPFRILFLAADRSVLRRAARLMTAFGYQVESVTDIGQATQLLSAERHDLLLIDGAFGRDELLPLLHSARELDGRRYTCKLLFISEPTPQEVLAYLEAGVDDFLGGALEPGELLARLRGAVRVLECERRLAHRSRLARTRLLGRSEFAIQAASDVAAARAADQQVACVAVAIDHYSALETVHGRRQVENLENRLIAVIEEVWHPLHVGRLCNGRFCMCPQLSATEIDQLVDALQENWSTGELSHNHAQLRPTLSIGIAESMSAATSDELIAEAEKGLHLALSSGGDCAVRSSQFIDEDQQWSELAANGGLFENTFARDIMVPCPVVIRTNDTIGAAAALFEQTQCQALPVVDEEGKLAGLLTATAVQLQIDEGETDRAVSSTMTSDMASFDERTSLAALVEYFSQESPLAIVIVHKGRPSGLVTPSSLATLGEQLDTETFAADLHAATSLLVPNLRGIDA